MKKRSLAILLVAFCLICLTCVLCACGNKETQTTPPTAEDTPSSGGDTPSLGGDSPSTGGNTPSTGGEAPSTGGNTPAIGTEFTVTLDVEGCKPLEKTEFTVQFGRPYQLPVPIPENEIYTEFLGWAYNGIRLSASDGSVANWNIEQNATLKAEFGGCVLLVKNGALVGHSDRIALVDDLVIPSEIDGQTITSIGSFAFVDCTTLTSLSIPDSVTTIGKSAFWGCGSIKTVTLGAGIKSIGAGAFANCDKITSVNHLGTLKSWCEIEFEDDIANPFYTANYHAGTAKLCVNGVEVTEVKDLDGVEQIPAYAFYGLTGITSVTIPDSVQNIGELAFLNCTGLRTATIGKGVQSIGRYAFSGCTKLETVTFIGESKLKEIMSDAFSYCDHLKRITIPASVTSIGSNAFEGCIRLKDVAFEDPTGWQYDSNGRQDIPEEQLRDHATAAELLTTTYVKYGWYRKAN